jgi:hypothetical protein
VDTVIVDGRVLLRNRRFTTLMSTTSSVGQAAFKGLLSAPAGISTYPRRHKAATALKLKPTQQTLKIPITMGGDES